MVDGLQWKCAHVSMKVNGTEMFNVEFGYEIELSSKKKKKNFN